MEEAAPAAAVCRNVFPDLGVNFQGFHISFAHILDSKTPPIFEHNLQHFIGLKFELTQEYSARHY